MSAERIVLTGLRATGRHGVHEAERRAGQPFVADVAVDLDAAAAARSDALADTADYGALARAVTEVLAGEPVRLLETLAERVAVALLRDGRVDAVEVTVHKPQAPLGVPFDDVAVRLRRERIVLALGSNVGDRHARLQAAVTALAGAAAPVAVSDVFETAPVGGPEQPDYLNAVLVAAWPAGRDPLPLAAAAEAAAGRERGARWGPRTLDVDVVVLGARTSADPRLTLPHPRAADRAFVLLPWLTADPLARLPGAGAVRDLPAARPPAAGVRLRSDLSLRLPR